MTSFLIFIFAVAAFFKHFPEAASFLLTLNYLIVTIILLALFGWNFFTGLLVVLFLLNMFGMFDEA